MTTADMLRAEGRLEGYREALVEQLEIRFGPIDSAVRARVEKAPLEQFKTCLRRIVFASTLGEVFED